ncbi:MAG TPA: oxidoreductase [Pseudonocardia sp.]|jgi:NAD(P)-dependent dehydrogenase (short-subunit alcohol dehydrogenase family)|nr:oxidoreductase [Pseudonocardia sp.]
MDLQLNGKVAVVTGGSKGIGLAITRAMVAEGVRVVAGARSEGPDLAELASAGNVHPVAVDLTAPDGPARLIDEAVRAFGGIDILVNNVGAAQVRLDGFLAVTDEDWANSLSVNFLSAVRTIRAALPHLLERTPATIVTVSSVNAFLPDPVVIDYSAAKAALSNLCKSLSKEFGPRGLRVNMVSPGPVETALWLAEGGVADTVARATGSAPSEVAKHAVADSATGRFTHPEEVADAVLLLASGRAGNITGADLVIDGGLIQTL